MELNGIFNLAQRFLDQSIRQANQAQAATATPAASADHPDSEDRFTPAAANRADQTTAAAAGVFQGARVSVFSEIADFLFFRATGAPLTPPTAQLPTPAPGTPSSSQITASQASPPQVAEIPPPTVTGGVTPVPASNTGVAQGGTQVAALPTGTEALATAAPAPPNPVSSQSQLQALNNTLAALGLDPTQLAVVDRIALLLQDFSPLAFTSLVNQLTALAQTTVPQASAAGGANPTGANANPNPNPATSTTTPAGSTATTPAAGAFQLQSLEIKFTGVQATLSATPANGDQGNAVAQLFAFDLQVQEVNLTLANGNGQIVSLQAPSAADKQASEAAAGAAPSTNPARAIAATA
jgi:hypothetical protein